MLSAVTQFFMARSELNAFDQPLLKTWLSFFDFLCSFIYVFCLTRRMRKSSLNALELKMLRLGKMSILLNCCCPRWC